MNSLKTTVQNAAERTNSASNDLGTQEIGGFFGRIRLLFKL